MSGTCQYRLPQLLLRGVRAAIDRDHLLLKRLGLGDNELHLDLQIRIGLGILILKCVNVKTFMKVF